MADTSSDHLFARVVTAYPSIAGLPAAYQDRTRKDLRWIVRFTGAAVLTGDPTVLDDFSPPCCRSCTDASRTTYCSAAPASRPTGSSR